MGSLNERFEVLDELIRKVYSLIAPHSIDYRLKWLMDRDLRTKHLERYPKCYLSLTMRGRQVPFFPICNRTGIEDPDIISFSLQASSLFLRAPAVDRWLDQLSQHTEKHPVFPSVKEL